MNQQSTECKNYETYLVVAYFSSNDELRAQRNLRIEQVIKYHEPEFWVGLLAYSLKNYFKEQIPDLPKQEVWGKLLAISISQVEWEPIAALFLNAYRTEHSV